MAVRGMTHRFFLGTAIVFLGASLLLGPMLAWLAAGGKDGDGCPPIPNTPYFTIAYGTVQLDGTDAPVGTVVEAVSPRGDVVGCFEVSVVGHYGAMYIYGEDTSASPPIPGMRDGEEVTFRVNGAVADASPVLIWHNDREPHEVNLTVSLPTPTHTSTPTGTSTPTQTETPTPTETSTPTSTPTHTPTPTGTSTPTPTPTMAALPDLIVQDLVAAPEAPVVGKSIIVTVTIRNQGNGAVGRFFYTDAYADHLPTGCGDLGWDYIRTDALGIGEEVSLVFTYAGFTDPGTHTFYAQVDSGCQVEEGEEGNNIYGPLRVQVSAAAPPQADFTASPTWGFVPLSVQFTDLSTGGVEAWLWEFGDGDTSTLQNPAHLYTSTGLFTVSLTVSGPGGSDTIIREKYITVNPRKCIYLPLILRS